MADDRDGIHAVSDQYVADLVALDPITGTALGVSGGEDRLTDYSPDGHRARADLAKRALARVSGAEPRDESERVAQAVFRERVGLDVELHEAGADMSALNVIASPVQDLRQVFDLMPGDTPEQWHTIARRLAAMPEAVGGLCASLREAARAGDVAAARQVHRVAEQCDTWSGKDSGESFFAAMINRGADQEPALRQELERGAELAAGAYRELAEFLRSELLPQASDTDAVGEERYRLWSRYFLGARLDLHEAYEWGWNEFAALEREMHELVGSISSGSSVAEVARSLDEDERYRVRGQDALRDWMQQLADSAIGELAGVEFDIPEQLRTLECRIAPPGGGVGAYYTGPTEDFQRPGRMWWSLPQERTEFPVWREVTVVYHEGVPGHHLQVGTAVHEAQRLNRFQRLACFVSAHGEGWALYAERLMRELGYLQDPAYLLGMLNEQLFRAARVIVDIGMHLQLEIPRGTGFHEGERWTPELGRDFMLQRTVADPEHVRDEIDRYLGWPGQAPSYKLGERLWRTARDEVRQRHGTAFSRKEFHRRALELGPMGLDTLREQLAQL